MRYPHHQSSAHHRLAPHDRAGGSRVLSALNYTDASPIGLGEALMSRRGPRWSRCLGCGRPVRTLPL